MKISPCDCRRLDIITPTTRHDPITRVGLFCPDCAQRQGSKIMFEITSKQMLNRRRILKLMSGTAVGAALTKLAPDLVSAALAASPAIPAVTARFSMVSYTNHTWPIIGIRNGFFDDVGIKLQPADGRIVFENQTVPILENNEVDIGTIFVGVLTPALDKIKNIHPFLIHSYWQGNTILTGPNSGFKTVDDLIAEGKTFLEAAKLTVEQLKGHKLTVPPTISTRPWLEFVYGFAGMKLEDSELVMLEDPNAVQLAVSGGSSFAAPAGAVQIYQLQFQANWRPLISTRQMVKYAGGTGGAPVQKILNYDGFAATSEYIAANKDTIHRFNSALYRTMAGMFGANQTAELEKQIPFVNSANGSTLDTAALKFIFSQLDPFFPWEAQTRLWADSSDPLFYKNVYGYQVQKFIDDKTIAAANYDLDELFVAKSIWQEAVEMKAKATSLAAKADAAKLSDKSKALAVAGKTWIERYNYLDAVRFLETALS
jgi:ABC-type nitrate/sulfonate/bicarbonate transport system substrate-binding protein